MPNTGDSVTVTISRKNVVARFLGWNAARPTYADVTYSGRRYLRKLAPDGAASNTSEDVSANDPVVENPGRFNVKELFEFIHQSVEMVISGYSVSMIVTGSGGVGKTRNVMETITKNDLGACDYTAIKGYSTARSLYCSLHESNGKIIIFDDCDSVLDDRNAVNILKGALDSGSHRCVSWHSSTGEGRSGVPASFEFTGRIIFISNKTVDKVPQPLRSRSLVVDVTMTNDEKIERIRQVMPEIGEEYGFNSMVQNDALALIVRHKNVLRDLNIRTFINAAKIRASQGNNWERFALYIMSSQSF